MLSLDTLFLFLFILTSQIIIKNVVKFIGVLLGNDAKFASRDLLFLYLSISYFLTYLITT